MPPKHGANQMFRGVSRAPVRHIRVLGKVTPLLGRAGFGRRYYLCTTRLFKRFREILAMPQGPESVAPQDSQMVPAHLYPSRGRSRKRDGAGCRRRAPVLLVRQETALVGRPTAEYAGEST